MRRLVAYGSYAVLAVKSLSSKFLPLMKDLQTTGETPNRYSTIQP